MKYRPTNIYTFPWPVKVTLPSQDTVGTATVEEFTGIFRLLQEADAKAIQLALMNAKTAEEYVDATKAQIRAVLVGWEAATVLGDDDKPVPFSAAELELYLQGAPFRDGVVEAYGRALAARPAEGN